MIKCGLTPRLATIGAKFQSFARWKWFFSLAIAVLVTVAATPPPNQNPDEQFIQIMTLIDKADALRKAGQADAAKAKYIQAEKALLYFKAVNPLYSPRAVAYRLKEVSDYADARPPVPEPKPLAPGAKASTNLEAPAATAKGGVKLLEAGAEPRSALRYHPKAGEKQTAIMTMKIKLDMPMPPTQPGGAPGKMPAIPTMNIPMDLTVQSVAANGDITYELVFGEVGITEQPGTPPDMLQQMKTQLAAFKGLTSTGIISSRGVNKKSEVKLPAEADPQVRQFMDQMKEGMGNMTVPLPEEAVGVGAKWEVKKANKVQTTSVEQNGIYDLASVEGDRASVKFTLDSNISQKAQAGTAKASGSANGTISLDLAKLAGPSFTLDTHVESPMGNNNTMKMDINMSIEAH
jgi:hypothetical protein